MFFLMLLIVTSLMSQECSEYNGRMLILNGFAMQNGLDIKDASNVSKLDVIKKHLNKTSIKRYSTSNIKDFTHLIDSANAINNTAGSGNEVTGIRVYFVVLAATNNTFFNKLTAKSRNEIGLLWVFTRKNTTDPKFDDENYVDASKNTYCYFFGPNTGLHKVTPDVYSKWISAYNLLSAQLDTHIGRTESKSVWYNLKELVKLRCFLLTAVTDPSHTPVNFTLATYKDGSQEKFLGYDNIEAIKDVSKQLTFIIQIPSIQTVSFYKSQIKKYFEKQLSKQKKSLNDIIKLKTELKKADFSKKSVQNSCMNKLQKLLQEIDSADFDTGLPCPPDDRCIKLETP
jgi:hypothetical protein